jgi:predicted Zn-dependent protease
MRHLKWLVVAAAVAAACATNPATGRRQLLLISEQEEIQLGRESDQEVRQQMGVYEDADLQRYVERVGRELVRSSYRTELPWTFTVVDEQAVNAFALPGGFVYLTRGILPFLQDESELAAVMGHEIGHVDGRHGVDAYSRQLLAGGGLASGGVFLPEIRPFQGLAGAAFGLMFLKHSRDAELEADQLGVRYAAAQGWDPDGMPGLLSTLDRLDEASGSSRGVPNWALTHPPAADRVTKVQEAVAAARTPAAQATNRTEFERHLDGLVFGDSREKGFVRGADFLHPVMRFALRFPDGWLISNTDEQVTAVESDAGTVGIVLRLVPNPSGSIEQTARAHMTSAGFQEISGRGERINGLTAYVGTYEATADNRKVSSRAAHIRLGSQTFMVAGLAAAGEFGRATDEFAAAIGSFRELSREEADRLQPDRVDFRVVRAGDTWESLARQAGGRLKASTIAIMNGGDPGTPPRAGERIRIIIGG